MQGVLSRTACTLLMCEVSRVRFPVSCKMLTVKQTAEVNVCKVVKQAVFNASKADHIQNCGSVICQTTREPFIAGCQAVPSVGCTLNVRHWIRLVDQ